MGVHGKWESFKSSIEVICCVFDSINLLVQLMRSMFIDEIYIDKADNWVPLKTPPELRSSSKASPTWEISKFSHCNTLSWVKPDSNQFPFNKKG